MSGEKSHDSFREPWQHTRQTASDPTASLLDTAFTPVISSAPDAVAEVWVIVQQDATGLDEVIDVQTSTQATVEGEKLYWPLIGLHRAR